MPRFTPRGWHEIAGTYVLEDRRFDAATSRMEVDWTCLVPEAGTETKHLSMRLYSTHELVTLLRDAGFSDARVIDAATGAPLALGSSRAHAIATR